MKAILVNYNYRPEWLLTSGLDWLIYDRSDSKEYLEGFPQERIVYTENIGQVDYDKLGFLIDHYDYLPDVFLWAKTNLYPRFVEQADFEQAVKANQFAPLLRKDHPAKPNICGYNQHGMYIEIANSWFFGELASRYVRNWEEWRVQFQLPQMTFIPFPPGGNFILTKERVHRYSVDYYKKMRDALPYSMNPAEAHCAERSYYLMWK